MLLGTEPQHPKLAFYQVPPLSSPPQLHAGDQDCSACNFAGSPPSYPNGDSNNSKNISEARGSPESIEDQRGNCRSYLRVERARESWELHLALYSVSLFIPNHSATDMKPCKESWWSRESCHPTSKSQGKRVCFLLSIFFSYPRAGH